MSTDDPKGELTIGTRKSLQTDRVVLVPGPSQEVHIVRRMYHHFDRRTIGAEIAQAAERRGRPARTWIAPGRAQLFHQVLTNEKYVGHNVYNRTSFKLKKKRVRNPPDMWVRATVPFRPSFSPPLFEAVRRIVQDRARRFSDDEMLTRLSALLEQTGWLSGLVIDERDDMPSTERVPLAIRQPAAGVSADRLLARS